MHLKKKKSKHRSFGGRNPSLRTEEKIRNGKRKRLAEKVHQPVLRKIEKKVGLLKEKGATQNDEKEKTRPGGGEGRKREGETGDLEDLAARKDLS